MAKLFSQHRCQLPASVLLFALCLWGVLFWCSPKPAYAVDSAQITRIREYFPADGLMPDTEIFYPQLSRPGKPGDFQKANALMREYALGQYRRIRQAFKDGTSPAEGNLTGTLCLCDYTVRRNGGGYCSIQLENPNASLASPRFGCYTVRLSDQTVCRLSDLFLRGTDYPILLQKELSRLTGQEIPQICHDTPFFLTEDAIMVLAEQPSGEKEFMAVPLSTPAVARRLVPWL